MSLAKIVSSFRTRSGFCQLIFEYLYPTLNDKKNNIIEDGFYFSDGSIVYIEKYKYDNKGNKVEEARYIEENKFEVKQLIHQQLIEYKYIYSE